MRARPEGSADLQGRLAHVEGLLGTDPAAADRQADAILEDVPGHVMARLFKGIARRLMGDAEGAIAVLTPLSEAAPDAPLVHLQLGLAQRQAGMNDAAVRSIQRAVDVKPDFSDAWLALADLLTATGRREDADSAFMTYLRHCMKDPRLLEAATALRQNRVAEADAALRRHLGMHHTDIAAMFMLADVSLRGGRPDDAENLLARCLELAPGYDAARHNYALVLLQRNKAQAALGECDRLLSAQPRSVDLRKLRAAILVQLAEYRGAIDIYDELLGEVPDDPRLWSNLGHALRTVGEDQRCIEAYRRAIALSPRFGEAYWNLANLKTREISDAELGSMRAEIAKPDLPDQDRIHMHFAMGKALEDRRDFEESFRNYVEGNRLRRQHTPYDAGQVSDHVRRSRALFTPEFFAGREGWGSEAPDPIFVVGLPRAGSTLVEQILASHSAVEGTMELPHITAIAKSLGNWDPATGSSAYPEVLAGLDADAIRREAERYLRQTRVYRKGGAPSFIDKMPNNFAHLGLIHLMFPGARIIDVRRHPLACGLSVFKHLFARGQDFSYSLDDIGAYYRDYVVLMAHFDAVLPGRVHRVVYESLVENTEAEIRRLLEYCGLPFEAACISYHENRRAVYTASSSQVRSPIFRDALEHWRHYERWLEPLQRRLGPLIDAYPEVPAEVMVEQPVDSTPK